MKEERKGRLVRVVATIVALALAISFFGVSAQGPPPLPVKIQGNVVYGNDTRVPAGWLVTATDITASVELGNNITDLPPSLVIPQYKILVDPSQIIVGHEIKAWVSNGDWYGEATHTVQTGENDPGHVITMPNIVVSMNAPPTVTVETPNGTQCGNVTINYTLMDANSDACSIAVQFKGGAHADWTTATVSGQTTGLTSSPGGKMHSITWQSGSDAAGEDEFFQVRITPSDGKAVGDANSTAEFEVDNKAPTIAFIDPTPANGAEVQVNYVVVNVSIADDDVDTVWLDWNGTILQPGSVGAGAGSSKFVLFAMAESIFTFNVTNLTIGEHTYTVYANDTTVCGNVGASKTRMVIVPQYNLTISSTDGGNVTDPGEGTFPYPEGSVVNLSAEAEAGYRFVNWTGDVGTIADVDAADTTITMDGDYAIVANFEEIATRTFELPLGAGWNLMSVPLDPVDAALDTVFTSASDGDELYAYDGGWLLSTYYAALPGWYGDFDTIELDKGYWYKANTAYTASIEGSEVGSRSVPLAAGWNLIGFSRLTGAGLDDVIQNASNLDELYAYDGGWLLSTYYAALPGWYGDFDTLQPGSGYWYKAKTPFTWEY